MKIGVISDTHMPVSAQKLPQKVYDHFRGCDLIIHAGDSTELSVIQELGKIAETKAVRGNMDSPATKERLPEKLELTVGGKRIGVVHGSGPSLKVQDYAREAFREKMDIIIFGHSHIPFNEFVGDTLFFNPGSATDRVFARYRSFGLIEIQGDDICGKIIRIDD